MKSKVMHNNFKSAVKMAQTVVAKKPKLPVLRYTKIGTDEDGKQSLTLQTTNLEQAITVRIPARIEIAGDHCLDLYGSDTKIAKQDYRLDLEYVPEQTKIEKDGTKTTTYNLVTIRHSASASETYRAIDGSEFPVIPLCQRIIGTVDSAAFRSAFEFLKDIDGDRFYDPVVYLSADDTTLSLMCHDGVRLHTARVPFTHSEPLTPCAVSISTATLLARKLFGIGKIGIGQAVGKLFIQGENDSMKIEICAETGTQKPGDFESVLNADCHIWTLTVDPAHLMHAVKQAAIFAGPVSHNPKAKAVTLAIKRFDRLSTEGLSTEYTAYVQSESPIGDLCTTLETTGNAVLPERQFIFQIDLLNDILSVCKKITDGAITIRFATINKPVFFEVTGESGIALGAALMPCQPGQEYSNYSRRHTIDDETRIQWQEREQAEREYEAWIKDTFGLPAYTKTNLSLYRAQAINSWRDSHSGYDMVEVYAYLYADGNVPSWSSAHFDRSYEKVA